MMTLKDDARALGRTLLRWAFGLAVAAFGVYVVAAKISVWAGMLAFGFGLFILRPDDLTAFAKWVRDNAAQYIKPRSPS